MWIFWWRVPDRGRSQCEGPEVPGRLGRLEQSELQENSRGCEQTGDWHWGQGPPVTEVTGNGT